MFHNLATGKHIFHRSADAYAYTQLDLNFGPGFYPQVSLLDELHEVSPNATMIFLFRPIHDWIQSVSLWHNMKGRFAKFLVPGLVMTPQQLKQNREIPRQQPKQNRTTHRIVPLSIVQLAKWWCGHVLHMREYAREYPSHALIELDLYDGNGTSKFLHDLWEVDTDAHFAALAGSESESRKQQCWGHKNIGEEHRREQAGIQHKQNRIRFPGRESKPENNTNKIVPYSIP